MIAPFGDIKLKFGMYKGKQIQQVPNPYLRYLLSKDILKGKLLFHAQVRLNLPKKRFVVTVEDAAVGNGRYAVEAYNKKHAMSVCFKEHNIHCTQSYDGTSIDIQEL